MRILKVLGKIGNKSTPQIRGKQIELPDQPKSNQIQKVRPSNSESQLSIKTQEDFGESFLPDPEHKMDTFEKEQDLPTFSTQKFSSKSDNLATFGLNLGSKQDSPAQTSPSDPGRSQLKQRVSSVCVEMVPCTRFQFFSPKKQRLQSLVEASAKDLRVLLDTADDLAEAAQKVELELFALKLKLMLCL